jgi:hypothetical protein
MDRFETDVRVPQQPRIGRDQVVVAIKLDAVTGEINKRPIGALCEIDEIS